MSPLNVCCATYLHLFSIPQTEFISFFEQTVSSAHISPVTSFRTLIWETQISTYQKQVLALADRVAGGRLVRTKLTKAGIIFCYHSAHPTYLETICVHLDVSHIWVVPWRWLTPSCSAGWPWSIFPGASWSPNHTHKNPTHSESFVDKYSCNGSWKKFRHVNTLHLTVTHLS